jgi:hypothetical protein
MRLRMFTRRFHGGELACVCVSTDFERIPFGHGWILFCCFEAFGAIKASNLLKVDVPPGQSGGSDYLARGARREQGRRGR